MTIFLIVPHFTCPTLEPMKKIAGMGVGGCMLEILTGYLIDRSQIVLVGASNTKRNLTGGYPYGNILGTLLFCIFINELPEAEIQKDLTSLDRCGTENKM